MVITTEVGEKSKMPQKLVQYYRCLDRLEHVTPSVS